MLTPEQIAKAGTEHAHQSAFFAWAATRPQLKWMFAIPNGGERNAIVASRMKAEGTKTGIWDVFLPYPIRRTAGLFIEFKKPGREREKHGGLSEEQMAFFEAHKTWYAFVVVYSWEEAARAVMGYMSDVQPQTVPGVHSETPAS